MRDIEKFVPEPFNDGPREGAQYFTMVVELPECASCKKHMLYMPSRRPGMDPRWMKITWEEQAKRAGWVMGGYTTIANGGKYNYSDRICVECEKAGKSNFMCTLCKTERPTSEKYRSCGDPPEHLCKPCYNTVPAAQWDKAEEEMEERHRYDYC